MIFRTGSAVAAIVAAVLPGALAAAAPARCNISAYVSDPDPQGTNIRAAPSRGAAVLIRLPREQVVDEEKLSPELTITGFSGGWARVSQAMFADYGNGERVLFKGEGWIFGGLISATLNHLTLRSRPRSDAPVVARLMGPDWGPDAVEVLAIEDCLGVFAKVRGRLLDGRPVNGWADGLCSNQVTTCP